jgi:hypothetical protein
VAFVRSICWKLLGEDEMQLASGKRAIARANIRSAVIAFPLDEGTQAGRTPKPTIARSTLAKLCERGEKLHGCPLV